MKTINFGIIKPDAVERGFTSMVLGEFEDRDYTIEGIRMVTPERYTLKNLYDCHKEKPFFERLVSTMADRKMVAFVVSSNKEFDDFRNLSLDIRDWYMDCDLIQKNPAENVIHSCDSGDRLVHEIISISIMWYMELCKRLIVLQALNKKNLELIRALGR